MTDSIFSLSFVFRITSPDIITRHMGKLFSRSSLTFRDGQIFDTHTKRIEKLTDDNFVLLTDCSSGSNGARTLRTIFRVAKPKGAILAYAHSMRAKILKLLPAIDFLPESGNRR